jgi:hypothetical protein
MGSYGRPPPSMRIALKVPLLVSLMRFRGRGGQCLGVRGRQMQRFGGLHRACGGLTPPVLVTGCAYREEREASNPFRPGHCGAPGCLVIAGHG